MLKARTGWPPGLLQDDSRELSRWLASRPDARQLVRLVQRELREKAKAEAAERATFVARQGRLFEDTDEH